MKKKTKKMSKMSVGRKKAEIIERREEVKRLYYVQKFKIGAIANHLGVTYKTIERDTAAIRTEFVKEIKKETANKLITSSISSNEQIIKDAWLMYLDKKSKPITKLRALTLIQKTEESNIRIFQELGLIEKVADLHDLTGEVIVKWKENKKK